MNQGLVNGLVRRNKLQTHLARRRARETRELSAGEVGKLSERELLLIGVALYWAEGYKKSVIKNGKERTFHAISFTNTDPAMVRLFVRFLTEIIHLPQSKIRFHVRLFPHINEDDALRYWLEASGLPEESALKPTVVTSVSSLRKRPFNRLPYGVVQIRACDTKNFYRIMGWIDGIKQFVTV
ncbi:MAG: hypothetical protein Q8R39_00875 [bacterium]|nr:hypothetical protein [bacterium]MDZ4285065.1 hypothetical protein [Patescibacteria group bacterium]